MFFRSDILIVHKYKPGESYAMKKSGVVASGEAIAGATKASGITSSAFSAAVRSPFITAVTTYDLLRLYTEHGAVNQLFVVGDLDSDVDSDL